MNFKFIDGLDEVQLSNETRWMTSACKTCFSVQPFWSNCKKSTILTVYTTLIMRVFTAYSVTDGWTSTLNHDMAAFNWNGLKMNDFDKLCHGVVSRCDCKSTRSVWPSNINLIIDVLDIRFQSKTVCISFSRNCTKTAEIRFVILCKNLHLDQGRQAVDR